MPQQQSIFDDPDRWQQVEQQGRQEAQQTAAETAGRPSIDRTAGEYLGRVWPQIRQAGANVGIGAAKGSPGLFMTNPYLAGPLAMAFQGGETIGDPKALAEKQRRFEQAHPHITAAYNRAASAIQSMITPRGTAQQLGYYAPAAAGLLATGIPGGAAGRMTRMLKQSPMLSAIGLEAARQLPVVGPYAQKIPRWVEALAALPMLRGMMGGAGGAPVAPGGAAGGPPEPFMRWMQPGEMPESSMGQMRQTPLPSPASIRQMPGEVQPERISPQQPTPAQPIGARPPWQLQLPGQPSAVLGEIPVRQGAGAELGGIRPAAQAPPAQAPPPWAGRYGRGPGEVAPEVIGRRATPKAGPAQARPAGQLQLQAHPAERAAAAWQAMNQHIRGAPSWQTATPEQFSNMVQQMPNLRAQAEAAAPAPQAAAAAPARAPATATGDPLYEDAVRHVRETGQGSTTLLQRRLKIGYGRAVDLIDQMEQNGVVGPARGAGAREVLNPTQGAAQAARAAAGQGAPTRVVKGEPLVRIGDQWINVRTGEPHTEPTGPIESKTRTREPHRRR